MPFSTQASLFAIVCAIACGGACSPAYTPPAARDAPKVAERDHSVDAQSAGSPPLQLESAEAGPIAANTRDESVEPITGDPGATALQQIRLVPTSCEQLESTRKQLIEAKLRQMRQAMKDSFENWREAQPGCWEMYRERSSDGYGYSFKHGSTKSAAVVQRPSVARSAGASVSAAGLPKAENKVHSGSETNNQFAGVDEADLVKHDGRHVYFSLNGALRIASIDPPHVVSVTRVPGQLRELFVEGDRVVVYSALGGRGGQRCSYGYDCQFLGDGSRTLITLYDVADRSAPRKLRELELSGSLMAARRIGDAIHTVVVDNDDPRPSYSTWPSDLPECGVLEATVKQRLKRLTLENELAIRASNPYDGLPTLSERGVRQRLCQNLSRTPSSDGSTFTTIVSFDLDADRAAPVTATIQSRPGAVFVSDTALYLAVTVQGRNEGHWRHALHFDSTETSDIHRFRLGNSAGMTRYLGSGVIPGHVLNQFSMDEWNGHLRIATTSGRVPDPKVESQVSILKESADGNLVRTGAVEHLAPGEDIRSVRFDADRGYVVTFKKTDPLFVLDLRRSTDPKLLGQLKIPGFSTYMHRIDSNHLLSIGLDANDHGDFAYFDGVLLQLFDVTRPTEPKLLHKEKIGTRGSSSEAITNHLAFNYLDERGLLAVPMTVCEGGGDGRNGNELSFSGLLVYRVSVKDGFRRLGGVNHGIAGSHCGTWWSHATSAVKRSLFLDDWVWSIATDRAKVQKLSSLGHDIANLGLL